MRKLTDKEKQLLWNYSAGMISRQEFLQDFRFRPSYEEVRYLLEEALAKEKSPGFEAVWRLPTLLTLEEERSLYREYQLKDGHQQHENMARAFQTYFNDDVADIPVLVQAIDLVPSYLDDSDSRYPYIRKLIYAIGAHPEPESMAALEKIAGSEDETIKELALHQIEKRKRLGRWEREKR